MIKNIFFINFVLIFIITFIFFMLNQKIDFHIIEIINLFIIVLFFDIIIKIKKNLKIKIIIFCIIYFIYSLLIYYKYNFNIISLNILLYTLLLVLYFLNVFLKKKILFATRKIKDSFIEYKKNRITHKNLKKTEKEKLLLLNYIMNIYENSFKLLQINDIKNIFKIISEIIMPINIIKNAYITYIDNNSEYIYNILTEKIIESNFRIVYNLHFQIQEDYIFNVYFLIEDNNLEYTEILNILKNVIEVNLKRINLYKKLNNLYIYDSLTGLYVQKYFKELAAKNLESCIDNKIDLSFIILDIDNFKRFNDTYGHQTGDVVLKQVAETIKKNVRQVDVVCRYGGEEFAVLLRKCNIENAVIIAERIRKNISLIEIFYDNMLLNITVSVGVSTLDDSLKNVKQLIDIADKKLYNAKKTGKNKVIY